eukprot:2599756-Pleurochrysis_carterae.AAC.2
MTCAQAEARAWRAQPTSLTRAPQTPQALGIESRILSYAHPSFPSLTLRPTLSYTRSPEIGLQFCCGPESAIRQRAVVTADAPRRERGPIRLSSTAT